MKKSVIQPIQNLEQVRMAEVTINGSSFHALHSRAEATRIIDTVNEIVTQTNKNTQDIKFLADSLGKDILK